MSGLELDDADRLEAGEEEKLSVRIGGVCGPSADQIALLTGIIGAVAWATISSIVGRGAGLPTPDVRCLATRLLLRGEGRSIVALG